jgi:hypothetical protein
LSILLLLRAFCMLLLLLLHGTIIQPADMQLDLKISQGIS